MPSDDCLRWWLRECRDAGILIELAEEYTEIAKECVMDRSLLSLAIVPDMHLKGHMQKLNLQLHNEEMLERKKDIEYWTPLKRELEILRHKKS